MFAETLPFVAHLFCERTMATKLTKAFIEQAPDGVYTDPLTPGLSLRVRSGGRHRAWVFRRMVNRSRKDVGLGGVASVTLAQARLAAMQLRLMSDEDFLAHIQSKRSAKINAVAKASEADSGLTFRDVCNKFMEWNVRVGNWEDWNKSHRCFESIMRLHVFPHIGDMPFAEISAKDVAKIGAEIWDKTDLMNRSLQFTRQTFDWGKANGFFDGDNPADRKGALRYLLPRRKHVKQNRGALSVPELPDFFAELVRLPLKPARALFAFSVLTATRSATARTARWEQFNFEKGEWTIPPSQLKVHGNGALVVPLAPETIKFLSIWGIKKKGFLFTPKKTRKKSEPYSDATFSMTIKLMSKEKIKREKAAGIKNPKGWIDKAESLKRGKLVRITQHGVARATFRTWSQDDALGNDKRFVVRTAELCLHHKVKDAYNGAYERNESFIRRREMMEAWAEFCFSKSTDWSTCVPQAND